MPYYVIYDLVAVELLKKLGKLLERSDKCATSSATTTMMTETEFEVCTGQIFQIRSRPSPHDYNLGLVRPEVKIKISSQARPERDIEISSRARPDPEQNTKF